MDETSALLGEPQRTYEPRFGVRRWVGLVTLVAVVTAGVGFGWWVRHPEELRWGGYGFATQRAVDEPLWASVSDPAPRPEDRRVLTLDAIEPTGLEGRADVDYFVCRLRPVGDPVMTGSDDDVQQTCRELVPALGATLDLEEDPRQQLMVRVTPTRPGVVRIRAHRVTYGDGWQTGTDTVGPRLRIRARR